MFCSGLPLLGRSCLEGLRRFSGRRERDIVIQLFCRGSTFRGCICLKDPHYYFQLIGPSLTGASHNRSLGRF